MTQKIQGLLSSWRYTGWWMIVGLFAITVIAYLPASRAGFIWDDDVYVTKNELLTAPDGVKRIWFSLDAPSQYCPLVYTSFRIESKLWGLHPNGFHWVNILLHAANAALLFHLLRRLAVPGAWFAAALFALHPVQVESVAWISERKNVLSLLFTLLATQAWISFAEKAEKPRRAYSVAMIFYVLALLSKTTACTLPVAFLLILWLKKRPITVRSLLQLLPFVLLGLTMGLITIWWERHHQGTVGKHFAIGWLERLLIASRALWFYPGKLIWPSNLSFSYPRWKIDPTVLLAYAWLIAAFIIAGSVARLRRVAGRGIEVALLFYVITLSPLLGFIMLYTFRYTFVADHYQYVASIGPLALFTAGVSKAVNTLQGRKLLVAVPFGAALLAVLGTMTWNQCGMYANAETLWRTTIARNPAAYMAYNNLGAYLLRQGRMDEALAEFQQVVRVQPDYEVGYYNLGQALFRKGEVESASSCFQKAIELDPSYAAAHNNLGNIYLRKNQPRKALEEYEEALRLRPRTADFASNLAWLLSTNPDASVSNGPRAVQLAQQANQFSRRPNPVYVATLAAAHAEAGQFSDAVRVARTAFDLACQQYNRPLADALSRQIALYQSGMPFRDTGGLQ